MSNKDRFVSYVVHSVRLGGVIPLAELTTRALKAITGKIHQERSRRDYIKHLKESGSVYVYKKRIGRSFVLMVARAALSPCTKAKALYNNKKAKEVYTNNGSAESKISQKSKTSLIRLAWHLVLGRRKRQNYSSTKLFEAIFCNDDIESLSAAHGAEEYSDSIRALHWENCKVQFSKAHAFNYVYRMLRRGYSRQVILDRYNKALHTFHGLANDEGAIYSPSGVVGKALA